MKKNLIMFFLGAACSVSSQGALQLKLDEQFEDSVLNRSVWNTQYWWGRTIAGNGEDQYYTDGQNLRLENGILKLEARRQPLTAKIDSSLPDTYLYKGDVPNLTSFGYTSGMICSKEAFLYGKYEMRARLPAGSGCWPAFWLFIGWPYDEIDILEFSGRWRKRVSSAVHSYDTVKTRRNGKQTVFPGKNFTKKFHVFTCYWYPDEVWFEVDGRETFRFTTGYPAQYKRPMHIIANLAVGAEQSFAGKPNPDAFPKTFEIDYIRFWSLPGYP